MAKETKRDQTPETHLFDSHIIRELVKYVDHKPERLQYLRQCILPFFDMVFFSENVEGGDHLIREIVLEEDVDHV